MPNPVLYAGTYTGEGGGEGIYQYTINPLTGALGSGVLAAKLENPSYLAAHGGSLYAACELPQEGRIASFRAEGDGTLTPTGTLTTPGSGMCHLAVWPRGGFLSAACYGSGSFVTVRLLANGVPASISDTVQDSGDGPDKQRQDGPHAHSINPAPGGAVLIGCDLGIDKLLLFSADTVEGRLLPAVESPMVEMQPRSGPRHLAYSMDGRFVYVVGELDCSLTVFGFKEAVGSLRQVQRVEMQAGAQKGSLAAAVRLSPDGRFLYASLRGEDRIAAFAINGEDGKLSPVGSYPCGGHGPRDFVLDASGAFLIVANQTSGNLAVLSRDRDTGAVLEMVDIAELAQPVCLLWQEGAADE